MPKKNVKNGTLGYDLRAAARKSRVSGVLIMDLLGIPVERSELVLCKVRAVDGPLEAIKIPETVVPWPALMIGQQ